MTSDAELIAEHRAGRHAGKPHVGCISCVAARLGSIKTAKKARASRRNGLLGGGQKKKKRRAL